MFEELDLKIDNAAPIPPGRPHGTGDCPIATMECPIHTA
jgi:hypothetical protein